MAFGVLYDTPWKKQYLRIYSGCFAYNEEGSECSLLLTKVVSVIQ